MIECRGVGQGRKRAGTSPGGQTESPLHNFHELARAEGPTAEGPGDDRPQETDGLPHGDGGRRAGFDGHRLLSALQLGSSYVRRKTGLTRRGFLPATAAAFTIVPRHVLGAGYTAPSDKLNIAAVGVGGMGKNYVKGCASENIVAIADVDHVFAAPVSKPIPAPKSTRTIA